MGAILSVDSSDNYANKLRKFWRGQQMLGGPITVFVAPGKISIRGRLLKA